MAKPLKQPKEPKELKQSKLQTVTFTTDFGSEQTTLLKRIVLQNRTIIEALYHLGVRVEQMETKMDIDFAALEAEVARNTEVDTSASLLLTKLSEEIKKLGEGLDPAAQEKINAFAASLAGQNDALATAVAANTPAEA